jgi:hypothetical protein
MIWGATEAALLSVGGPRLLAAVALVHAERVTLTRIKHSVNELWLCPAPAAPNGYRFLI